MAHDRIEINPDVMFGKPVVRGTRIPVDFILRLLAGGRTLEEILAGYPRLQPEDVSAALEYAADCLPGPLARASVGEPASAAP